MLFDEVIVFIIFTHADSLPVPMAWSSEPKFFQMDKMERKAHLECLESDIFRLHLKWLNDEFKKEVLLPFAIYPCSQPACVCFLMPASRKQAVYLRQWKCILLAFCWPWEKYGKSVTTRCLLTLSRRLCSCTALAISSLWRDSTNLRWKWKDTVY